MRFAVAATLCLASHGVPAESKLSKESVAQSNQRNTLRGITQEAKGPHKRQLQNPKTKKLIRRLAEKRKERALKSANALVEDRSDSAVLDLGVIGNGYTESDMKNRNDLQSRDLRESIIDKNEILETSRETINDVPEDPVEVERLSAIDQLNFFCSELKEDDFIRCDCSNFDFESTNGSIECTYADSDGSDFCQVAMNYCEEPVEICYRHSISLEATSPQNYTYTYCQTYTKPYQQHVCMTFGQNGDDQDDFDVDMTESLNVTSDHIDYYTFSSPLSSPCSVIFNGMECSSCTTELETTQYFSFNQETGENELDSIYKERCFLIDCSNAGDESNVVNTCEGGFTPTNVKDNVIFGDDCTKCQPCGLGHRIKNPDAEGNFPVIGEYQCSGLELASKIGFFDRKLCPEVQAKTNEYCGCEPIFYDPDLVWTPENVTERRGFQSPYQPMVLLPGNTIGDAKCDVCGREEAIVANPAAIVTLPNGVMTSCSALQGAGRLGMFTADYCLSEVMPLVFRTCGGCFHDPEVNTFDPASIVKPPTNEEKEEEEEDDDEKEEKEEEDDQEPEKEEEEDDNENEEDNSNFVVGEGLVSCDICDTGSELALPDNLFTLHTEEISCREFEERLKNTAVTETFCVEEASSLADAHCGGCVEKATAPSVDANSGSIEIAASRIEGEKGKKAKPRGRTHREKPEELDVYSDPPVENNEIDLDTEESAPNAANSAISSSQSLKSAPTTWIAISTTLAISYSFATYFS